MNPISVDIMNMLQNAGGDWDESDWGYPDWATGLGEIGEVLHVGRMPQNPNNCVAIYDTPGRPTDLTLDGNSIENYEYGAVQIRVRNQKYRSGWFMADAIKTSLHGRAQETWNEALYTVIYCSSGPALLEWDDNNRAIFIINFEVQRRNTS